MTVDLTAITESYKSLLIAQYANKDKANDTIALLVEQLLADGIYWSIQDAYNLDNSVGVQLDVLGKYVGLTRDYQGTLLTDEDYRFLLKLKIAKNYTNHSAYEIATSMKALFDDNVIFGDNFNMAITYFVELLALPTAVIARNKECFPKPVGVNINLIAINDYFVFGEYGDVSGVIGFGFADYTDSNVEGGDFIQYNDIF